jgi:hypothetical protein
MHMATFILGNGLIHLVPTPRQIQTYRGICFENGVILIIMSVLQYLQEDVGARYVTYVLIIRPSTERLVFMEPFTHPGKEALAHAFDKHLSDALVLKTLVRLPSLSR